MSPAPTIDSQLNNAVQGLLDDLVASGAELGLQTAAYRDGHLVVDAWAGMADTANGRHVDGDTLFTVWSTTKGLAATCLHILADRGVVAYDAPVAIYWPEFAVHGKESVTVRHVLTHRAGIPQMPDGVTVEMFTDWEAMCTAIAAMKPLWEPGTATGYHAWTFGYLVGEIVHRADGRRIAQFAQEELCAPLGITDFYLGIPDDVEERVATLEDAPGRLELPEDDELFLRAMPLHITTPETMNRPDIRRACIPGGGGIMNARAIARHYAMLACDGELDGVRVLSAERIAEMRTLQTDAFDIVLQLPIRKALGYFLGGDPEQGGSLAMGPTGREFGHTGLGGSIGFADRERKLAFSLTKTLLTTSLQPEQGTAYRVAEIVRDYIDERWS